MEESQSKIRDIATSSDDEDISSNSRILMYVTQSPGDEDKVSELISPLSDSTLSNKKDEDSSLSSDSSTEKSSSSSQALHLQALHHLPILQYHPPVPLILHFHRPLQVPLHLLERPPLTWSLLLHQQKRRK